MDLASPSKLVVKYKKNSSGVILCGAGRRQIAKVLKVGHAPYDSGKFQNQVSPNECGVLIVHPETCISSCCQHCSLSVTKQGSNCINLPSLFISQQPLNNLKGYKPVRELGSMIAITAATDKATTMISTKEGDLGCRHLGPGPKR